MSFYLVVLFFHISGALILFMGMSLEWLGIAKLNNAAKPEQTREWAKFLASLKFAYMSAGILLFITGIYMAAARWGWTPWIIVSFLLWLFLILHGSVVSGGKVRKFRALLNSSSSPTSVELNEQLSKLKLMNLLQSRVVVGLGAVFIMTVKPDIVGAIGVVIVAIILGIMPILSKGKSKVPKLADAGTEK
jgi:hypothetical protein